MTNLIEIFKMLSDETRLRILVLLSNKELCVCEICDILKQSQPKVSRHLSKLRDIGFVKDERQGQWIFYYPNIQDEIIKKIIQNIVDNSNLYPVIKTDLEKLQKKLSENRMCNRENLNF
jgi:ArsR family transcriptional regulator